MLSRQGAGEYLQDYQEKYPTIELEGMDPQRTVLLFSSEPYPFQRYRDELIKLGFSCGLVDGEKYSWYGIRSLQFLEQGE